MVFICVCGLVNSQDFPVPDKYTMDEKEDYKPYEPQIKATIDWYLGQSLGSDPKKRAAASEFFMKWIGGTPDVSVGIDARIVNFMGTNRELLLPFIMGWVKYSLDNDYSKDMVLANKAGIEAVVAYYDKNKGFLKKDKNVEKYAKLIRKGQLEEEIRKIFDKNKK